MAQGKIGVGIIGAQPGRSWAAIAHMPALRALPQYDVVAVSTTKLESAKAAAQALGIPAAFGNSAELINHPKVDLVAVTVKVPHHLELVKAVLNAGKMVYCEWPLGNGLEEAQIMADLARSKKAHVAIGLQARSAPVINYVRDLIREGYIGQVLSTSIVASGMSWGPMVEQPNAYNADIKNGATMLAIPFGHTVDALCYCLGEFRELNATLAVRRNTTTVIETGETIPATAHDQVAVTGVLESGTVVSAHYRGGMARGTNMLWEINGTEGDLQIGAFGGHAQIFDLSLSGARGKDQQLQPMTVPEKYFWAPKEAANISYNMAQAYLRFANDLRDGTQLCPNFDDAVRRHKMLAGIEKAAASGQKVTF